MSLAVVDTDVVSFYLRQDSRFQWYAKQLDGKRLVISFMTFAELQLWQELRNWGQRRRDEVQGAIENQYTIYPVDRILCSRWATVKAEATRLGRVMHASDAWIAATAIKLNAPLVSHNRKDFDYLPNLQLISMPTDQDT